METVYASRTADASAASQDARHLREAMNALPYGGNFITSINSRSGNYYRLI